ncbi:DUF503 domain-containing protein [candidate division KSB1 bacterium]|nr:DUF503 domain-containing protein [candidate division KSB1 bacterium]
MLIGTCQIELFVPDSGSLKSKRFIIESIKTRIRQRFNVSISEIGDTEKWQRISLGIALVSNETRFIDKAMSQIINFIEKDDRVEILDYSTEIL